MERRTFMRWFASMAASGMMSRGRAWAGEPVPDYSNQYGVLVDTTLCVGCRRCEWACKIQNKLPHGPRSEFDDKGVFERTRRTDAETFTVVNRYKGQTAGKFIYVKRQCMHCLEPACASACLVKAFTKTKIGAVIYNPSVCIGCRYCIAACPFYMPAYQYDDPFTPEVTKCPFCYERIRIKGGVPACVEACPMEALTFGRRGDLLEYAHKLIRDKPHRYIHYIYGEKEVGGTSWLYLSSVPFHRIGFDTTLGTVPIPRLSRGFLSMVSVVLITWPALCMGFYAFSRFRSKGPHQDKE